MFKKLHLKLTIYMGVVLALFMIFVTTCIYYVTKWVYDDQTYKLLADEALKIQIWNNNPVSMDDLLNNSRYNSMKSKLLFLNNENINCNYVVYDRSLNMVFGKVEDEVISKNMLYLVEQSLEIESNIYCRKEFDGQTYRIFTKYINTDYNPIVIQVYENTESENNFWMFLKTVLWVVSIIGVVLLISISYLFTGKALKPVKNTWKKQKEFVADASHELRTPLTVIQTNLDVMLSDEEGTIEENEMWLNNAYSETKVMAHLIDQLLTLAKIDANEQKMDNIELSLSEIVENVTDNMYLLANNKGLKLVTEINEDVIIKGDYDKIRRLVVILIDNAIKYTESGYIGVSVYINKTKKILCVQDTGIGISQEDKNRIFDRFFRSDKARNRKSGGTGLGLSIAKWIVDYHKASMEVESEIGDGSKFLVKFN